MVFTLFEVLDVSGGEGDSDLVRLGRGGTRSFEIFISFSDVTHDEVRR